MTIVPTDVAVRVLPTITPGPDVTDHVPPIGVAVNVRVELGHIGADALVIVGDTLLPTMAANAYVTGVQGNPSGLFVVMFTVTVLPISADTGKYVKVNVVEVSHVMLWLPDPL
jgi:hypothetical protein